MDKNVYIEIPWRYVTSASVQNVV